MEGSVKASLRSGLYPGTFDPVTNGHIDLIRRALHLFEELVVAVAVHPEKGTLFPVEERVAMLKAATRRWPKVKVRPFDGLVVDLAQTIGAGVIIRGLRMLSDFEYEFQMALTNRKLAPRIETVFMMPSEEYSYLSSRLIKEAAALGADVRAFVTPEVARRLKEKSARYPNRG